MSDPVDSELINKITELQQEAKEHMLVLDAFKSVEPTRKCFRMIGGVLVERTVADIKPTLEENLSNIDKAIGGLNDTLRKRREQRASGETTKGNESAPLRAAAPITATGSGVLA